MVFVENGTGCDSETFVTFDVNGAEEGSIKFEAIYVKDEIPEATSFPPIKTEHEVRLGVCVRWWQLMLLGHLLT
jgi:hypothetical protein